MAVERRRLPLLLAILVLAAQPALALSVVGETLPTLDDPLAPAEHTTTTDPTTTDAAATDPLPTDGLENATSDLLPIAGEEYVVGFSDTVPTPLLNALGGRVRYVDPVLRFAVVWLPSATTLEALVGIHPSLTYVERNGAVFPSAAQWDAAQWDGARWDGASWDAAQWDSEAATTLTWDAAQWDGVRWDGVRWDGVRWDAASWDPRAWRAAPIMDVGFPNAWHLGAMHADEAWNVTMGPQDRTLCVIDSGVDARHPDLSDNIKRLADGTYGYDFVNGDNEPLDDGGHGTHVAGAAAAVTGNAYGVSGVSQALILAAKILNSTGYGKEADLAKALRWCAENGANIGVMALHTEQDNAAVREGIRFALARGMLLVAASGNDGARCADCVAFPARYDGVLAVGASAPDANAALFSNGGKDLDLLAPGVQIPGPLPSARYAVASGTSQATAVAAGAAAIVWSADLSATAQQVAQAMTSSAKPDGTGVGDFAYGHGHLRLDRALRAMGLLE